ncbi:rho-associated protein kinase 2-like [Danio rerio]|uniref:Rho-associated protein kinase 2-like n=1 Tax=Danio rerio TaxID=7955 RepID=A0AC58I6Z2_DANRE
MRAFVMLEESNRTLTVDVANLASEKEELNNKLKHIQQKLEKIKEEEKQMKSLTVSYEKQIQVEKTLKIQAINKLAEVMKKTDGRPQQINNTDIRRKEKEIRQLQLQLRTEKEKLNHSIIKYQREINDMQAMIAEESQVRLEMQMSLDSKDSDIEHLRSQLTSLSIHSLDTTSISSIGNDLDSDEAYPDKRLSVKETDSDKAEVQLISQKYQILQKTFWNPHGSKILTEISQVWGRKVWGYILYGAV